MVPGWDRVVRVSGELRLSGASYWSRVVGGFSVVCTEDRAREGIGKGEGTRTGCGGVCAGRLVKVVYSVPKVAQRWNDVAVTHL